MKIIVAIFIVAALCGCKKTPEPEVKVDAQQVVEDAGPEDAVVMDAIVIDAHVGG